MEELFSEHPYTNPFLTYLLTLTAIPISYVHFRPFLSSDLSGPNRHFYLDGPEASQPQHGEIQLIILDSPFIFPFSLSIKPSPVNSISLISLHSVQVPALTISCLNCSFCSQPCSLQFTPHIAVSAF